MFSFLKAFTWPIPPGPFDNKRIAGKYYTKRLTFFCFFPNEIGVFYCDSPLFL